MSRYPYTYAADYIRKYAGEGYPIDGVAVKSPKLSRSDASQVRRVFSRVLDLNDEELAKKLADAYLAEENATNKSDVEK